MLQTISKDGFIDTTDENSLRGYYSNLQELIFNTREQGRVDKFVIVRSDDFFPYDSKWIINSEYTTGEYRPLTTIITPPPQEKKGLFNSVKKKQITDISNASVERLDIYSPTSFRSTKHFTVNTALGATGQYNDIKVNRRFTVIDSIDYFINSGYGYSLSERDTYLDVSHEALPISKDAIVLVSTKTFEEIKEDKKIMEQLSKLRLIVFKGDQTLATNMVLTENGFLPTNCEIELDSDIKDIISNSIKTICINNNLDYNRSHGMRGHFTSYIDQANTSSIDLISDFIEFINKKLGSNIITQERNIIWKKYIDMIGLERFKSLLEEFNNIQKDIISNRKDNYLKDRATITPEISELFKNTVKLIREHEEEISFVSVDSELSKIVFNFYLSPTVQEQVEYAKKINEYFTTKTERRVIA